MKFYVILAAVAALAVGFVFYTYYVYDAGREAEKARTAAQVEEYRENQRLLLDKLAEERSKERVVVKTKIKKVREVVDTCADQPIHPDIRKLLD